MMNPKRLRLIADIIRHGLPAFSNSTRAIAQELEELATDIEKLHPKPIRLREPATEVKPS